MEVETQPWIANTLRVLPDETEINQGAFPFNTNYGHFGVFLLRREMVIGFDESMNPATPILFKPAYYEEFLDLDEYDNSFYLNYYGDDIVFPDPPTPVGPGSPGYQDYLDDLEVYHQFLTNQILPYTDWDLRIKSDEVPYDPDDAPNATLHLYLPTIGKLFVAQNADNIQLTNVAFRYASAYPLHPMVQFKNCNNILIEDCDFSYSGGTGLNLGNCDDVEIRTTTFSNCGKYGLATSATIGMVVDGCTLEQNNWKAYTAGTMDWACGAWKAFWLHDAQIDDLTTRDNYGTGFWIDQDGQNITIDNLISESNYGSGVFFEISPGPITMTNSVVRDNCKNQDPVVIGPQSTELILNTVDNVSLETCEFSHMWTSENHPAGVPPVAIADWRREDYGPIGQPLNQILYFGSLSVTSCDFYRSGVSDVAFIRFNSANFNQANPVHVTAACTIHEMVGFRSNEL